MAQAALEGARNMLEGGDAEGAVKAVEALMAAHPKHKKAEVKKLMAAAQAALAGEGEGEGEDEKEKEKGEDKYTRLHEKPAPSDPIKESRLVLGQPIPAGLIPFEAPDGYVTLAEDGNAHVRERRPGKPWVWLNPVRRASQESLDKVAAKEKAKAAAKK